MSRFSPAPWKVSGQSDRGRYITVQDARGRVVARIPFSREGAPLAEIHDDANAQLVARCPALLAGVLRAAESLKSAIFLLDRHMPRGWRKEWLFEETRRDLLELAAEAQGHGRGVTTEGSREEDDLAHAARLALRLIRDTWPVEHGIPQVGEAWGALERALPQER